MINLEQAFWALTEKYSKDQVWAKGLWSALNDQYQGPKRYYHNLQHLEMLFKELLVLKTQIEDWDTLLWALIFHDMIYKVQRKDNERQSANYASTQLEWINFPKEKIKRCVNHILATKDHPSTEDMDTNFFVDADLSILGQKPTVYNQYTQKIRLEYQIFPDALYQAGRREVVQHFLDRKRIFKTDFFYKKYEKQARHNLSNELSFA